MKLQSLIILAILPMLIVPAFGDEVFTINTTKAKYEQGDSILILGSNTTPNITLIITLIDVNGNIIKEQETISTDDGYISDSSFIIPLDITPGLSTISITDDLTTATTSFEILERELDVLERVMINESMIIIQNEQIISHNSTIFTLTNTTDSNSIMLNNHDNMIYPHEDKINEHYTMFENQNILIDNLNQTNILQQLEIDDLKNDLSVLGGYLINLNVTLGVDFPPILNENAIKEVNKEIQRLEDEIDVGDDLISDTLIELEIAQSGDEPNKIIKLTESLGSAILSREIAQSKLNMIFLYLEIYPQ